MTRWKVLIEYDGTNLVGWQSQDNGQSVQALLSDAIFGFCGERVEPVAAGRTDAGVHAIAMPAHFDIVKETDADTLRGALNFYLKDSPVAVLLAEQVNADFHARFSARARHYRYDVLCRRAPSRLMANRAWWIPRSLDLDLMSTEAKKLIGHHNFNSFRSSECQAASPIKTLDAARIEQNGDVVSFYFSARSFLHHQVRNMVGTLADIGLGKPLEINEIIAAENRAAAGQTAPACGLYFISADY
ncbi:MAG: tRNA pseudouridine(38-40) synthase TruA [Rickettsiales bacterium]|jgi:tRNA pseudouridine38-40 synthase|nr:tRNA pseudouridine(38-40) synthase TruA [Rickettsiales bacterium]